MIIILNTIYNTYGVYKIFVFIEARARARIGLGLY